MTETDILGLMECGIINNEEGLIGAWNFNEGPIANSANELFENIEEITINSYNFSTDTPEINCLTQSCLSTDNINVTFSQEGCTDELACNYDSNAVCDDNSCEY